jgi:TonB-dependent SusC/RagA subfamily outer membrane receptor
MLAISIIILAFLYSHHAHAQVGSGSEGMAAVKGTVSDQKNGELLSGIRLTMVAAAKNSETTASEGGQYGYVTGAGGVFTFTNLKPGRYVLKASALTYKTASQTIAIEAGQTLQVALQLAPDVKGLEEVVVTGVASRTQKGVAEVAVSRVEAAELTKGNVFQDMTQLLAGKVAGVQITPASGNVGGGIRFSVRSGGGLFGTGQPVIFLDGVRIDNSETGFFDAGGQGFSTLADINPEDIQSVEILKGPASSALYGTSGSNGVVLIATKSGAKKAINKLSMDVKTVVGWNEQSRRYTEDMALSYEKANNLFRRGPIWQTGVSLTGNTGFVNYYASIDHRNEAGILVQNQMQRTSLRANIDATPSEFLTIKLSTNFIDNNLTRPQNDDNVYGLLNNTLGFRPEAVYSNSGDSLGIMQIENSSASQRFIGSGEITWKPLQGLTLRGLAGYDATNTAFQEVFPQDRPLIRITNGERSVASERVQQFNADLSAAYTFKPSDNLTSTTLVGAQLFSRVSRSVNLTVQNFPTNLIEDTEAGATFVNSNQSFGNRREAGVFVQQEVNYADWLFVSAGIRNDYASSIGPRAPSIFYPRASAAARLDRLGLGVESLNLLKVRVAYGQSGQLPSAFDGVARLWGPVQSGYGVGATLQRIGNLDIQPERIEEIEVGIEAEFSDSYGIDFTYYQQFATNSIIDFINSPSTGLTASSIPRNVGSIRGWGFESSLYATPIRSTETLLQFNLIANFTDNVVQDIGGAQPIFAGNSRNVIRPGLRRAAFFLFPVIEPRYNADGTYNYADGPVLGTERVYAGTPVPLVTGSFSTTFRFFTDFTLYGLVECGLGHSLYNNTRMLAANPARGNIKEYNVLATQLGLPGNSAQPTSIRLLPPYPGVERLTPNTPEYRAAAERFARVDHRQFINAIEPADFLRVREISLTWNALRLLRELFGEQFALKNLSFVLSGRNLALFSRYSGADVEVTRNGSRELSRGIDNYTLMQPRVFNFTLNIGF